MNKMNSTTSEVPVFVKLEEYDQVLSIVTVIKKKLDETKDTLMQIKQLKIEEEQEIAAWESNLKDVHEKVEFVDEILREPRF